VSSTKELASILDATTMPADLVGLLLEAAPPLWLASDSASALAADMALCHPVLASGEVRARVSTMAQGWRLTVVATDRPGLLADTASALAHENCSIASASAASWTHLHLALHSVTISGAPPAATVLDRLGARLRSAPATSSGSRFVPVGRAKVEVTGETDGDAILTVTAPDQAGLLAAICRWFADRGAGIQAAWVAQNVAGLAEDVFVVRGPVDRDELERFLGVPASPRRSMVSNRFRTHRQVSSG